MAAQKSNRRVQGRKPDEVYQYGPLTLARFGRVVQFESHWEPDDFNKWKATWPQIKEEAERKLRDASGRLQDALRRVRGADVLATLFTRFGLTDPTTFVESESSGGEHYTEYVASLIAAIPAAELGKEELVDADFDAIMATLEEIFDAARTSVLMSIDANDKTQLPEFRMQLMVRHLYVRGDSYPLHHHDLFQAFVAQHDAFLRATYGFGAAELLATLDAIEHQIECRLQNSVWAARCLKTALSNASSYDEAYEKLSKEDLEKVRSAFAVSATEFLEIDTAHPNIARAVLEHISCSPGENTSFLQGQFGGFPLAESLVHARPILKLDGRHICPSPILLSRSCFGVATALLDTDRYRENFQAKRGRLLEELSVQYLAHILPGALVHRSAYYYTQDGRRCETDAVILFDRHAFIVEAKAGSLSAGTRRGAPARIQRDFTRLVGDAFEQGRRVRKHILSSESAEFCDEDGNVTFRVRRGELDAIYIVNPTFAVVDPIGAQLGTARTLGLLEEADFWPWCVFINDLRVISELIHSPAEFVLYLQRRLKMNQTPMAPHDELDLFCKFLADGLYFEDGDFDGMGSVMLHAYTDVLDRWYIGRFHGAPVEKPAFPVPRNVRELTDAIETTRFERRTEVARLLLEFGSEALDQFDSFLGRYGSGVLAENERHDVSVVADSLDVGITIQISRAGQLDSRGRIHANARRHITDCTRWLLIAYSPDTRHCEFAFAIKGPLSAAEIQYVAHLRRRLVEKYVMEHGRAPDRNERCPCLSGKKFKKCCGA